jgi:hypothetical protein
MQSLARGARGGGSGRPASACPQKWEPSSSKAATPPSPPPAPLARASLAPQATTTQLGGGG